MRRKRPKWVKPQGTAGRDAKIAASTESAGCPLARGKNKSAKIKTDIYKRRIYSFTLRILIC